MSHFPVAGETERSKGERMARRRFLGVLGAGSGAAAIAASLGGFRSRKKAGCKQPAS